MKTQDPSVAIVGSGPAGLMAAFEVARAGIQAHVYEKRPGPGRKLLIAGSSGLNVTFDAPIDEFIAKYRGPKSGALELWKRFLTDFSPQDWLGFIEALGLETFLGTSRRYFVREMKASGLLKAWVEHLKSLGVEFHFNEEVQNFSTDPETHAVTLELKTQAASFSAVCFCLGGGSWEKNEDPLRWPPFFIRKGIRLEPFRASNCGFKVDWPKALLKEAEGLPLKGIKLFTTLGEREGELVITNYGLEGTPIYAIGIEGAAWIDLKPSLSEKEILKKVDRPGENLSPMRRIKRHLNLGPAQLALLYHLTPPEERSSLQALISRMKRLPIDLKDRQPLSEAISSSGGISWEEVNPQLMLKNHPGIFVAGEMLDWDAPTGGFLIQGCVSQGAFAGRAMVQALKSLTAPWD